MSLFNRGPNEFDDAEGRTVVPGSQYAVRRTGRGRERGRMPGRRGHRAALAQAQGPGAWPRDERVELAVRPAARTGLAKWVHVLFLFGLTYLWLVVSDPSMRQSVLFWAGMVQAARGTGSEAAPYIPLGAGAVEWTESLVQQVLHAGRVGPKGMLYPYRRDAMRTDEKYLTGPLVRPQLPNRVLTEVEVKGFWAAHIKNNVLPNIDRSGRATGTIVNIAGLGLQTIGATAFNANTHQVTHRCAHAPAVPRGLAPCALMGPVCSPV